jgi:hypothetical protein
MEKTCCAQQDQEKRRGEERRGEERTLVHGKARLRVLGCLPK